MYPIAENWLLAFVAILGNKICNVIGILLCFAANSACLNACSLFATLSPHIQVCVCVFLSGIFLTRPRQAQSCQQCFNNTQCNNLQGFFHTWGAKTTTKCHLEHPQSWICPAQPGIPGEGRLLLVTHKIDRLSSVSLCWDLCVKVPLFATCPFLWIQVDSLVSTSLLIN